MSHRTNPKLATTETRRLKAIASNAQPSVAGWAKHLLLGIRRGRGNVIGHCALAKRGTNSVEGKVAEGKPEKKAARHAGNRRHP